MSSELEVEQSSLRDEPKAQKSTGRVQRFLFGDDIFVSYARYDSDYALALADELARHDLACFLDQWGTPAGEELPAELVDRLNKSTMLVLVGSKSAAASPNVEKEVVEFKKTRRPIIPITFLDEQDFSRSRRSYVPENLKGTLEGATWHKEIAGIAKTYESKDRLKAIVEGSAPGPSPHVITRIVNAEDFVSRSKRLRKTFWTTLVSLLAVLTIAGITALVLITKAYAEVTTAESQQALAEKARNDAQALTGQAQADLLVAQQDLKTASDNLKIEKDKLEKASNDLIGANERTRLEQARAENARLEAEKQGRIASSQELAARAVSRMAADPEASVLMAKGAYEFAPTEQAGRALRRSLFQSHVRNVVKETSQSHSPVLDPTGQYAIVPEANGALNVQRVETGELLFTLPPNAQVTGTPNFSPDGKYVVIQGRDDKIYAALLWEWRAKISMTNPRTLHSDVKADAIVPCQCVSRYCPILSGDFSSDGRYFAAASRRGVAWVWDTSTSQRVSSIAVGETAINEVKFHPVDGSYVAIGDNDGQVLLWNWKTPKDENRSVYRAAGSAGSVSTIAFDHGGRFLVAAINPQRPSCKEGAAPPKVFETVVFNVRTGTDVTLTGHVSTINDVCFSPDGQYVLTGSSDGTARVYEWENPVHRLNPVILRNGQFVWYASFDPSGNYILTSGIGPTPKLWKPSISRELGRRSRKSIDSPIVLELRGHRENARATFSSDGKHILTTSDDGTARVWRNNANRLKLSLPDQNREISGAAFSPDGQHVVTVGSSVPVRVWDAQGGSREAEAELRNGEDRTGYQEASFSADGRYVIAAKNLRQGKTNRQVVDYWKWADIPARTKPRSILIPNGYLRDIAVSQHKEGVTYIATASSVSDNYSTSDGEDRTLNAARIWNLNADRQSKLIVLPHRQPVLAAAFSYDRESRYIATACIDGVRVFDWSNSDEPLVVLESLPETGYHRVAFSPDGRYVAAVDMTGNPVIWEWQTEEGRKNPLRLHSDSDTAEEILTLVSITFSPDSKLILTARAGGTMRLWDISTGDELQIIDEYLNFGTGASFSRDGSYILAPYRSSARIYECPECRPADKLIETVPERVSAERFRRSSNIKQPPR